jgi:hypothetical protein
LFARCGGVCGGVGGGGWRGRGFDVDLTSAEHGSAGAGRCFVRPWVIAVTPLCVDDALKALDCCLSGFRREAGRARGAGIAVGAPDAFSGGAGVHGPVSLYVLARRSWSLCFAGSGAGGSWRGRPGGGGRSLGRGVTGPRAGLAGFLRCRLRHRPV